MENAIDELATQFASQTWLDWAITLTALAYVWLAALERPMCWVFGIASSGLWAWADFARYNLWVDGLLQVFYIAMGFGGLWAWLFAKQKTADGRAAIGQLPLRQHLLLWLAGAALTVALGFLFQKFTPTSYPFADSFITAFSVIATFLTIRKVLESWLYWIVFDLLAVPLFLARDALLAAVVMFVYSLVAMHGWRLWRRRLESSQEMR